MIYVPGRGRGMSGNIARFFGYRMAGPYSSKYSKSFDNPLFAIIYTPAYNLYDVGIYEVMT
jgi:hypothetical protein